MEMLKQTLTIALLRPEMVGLNEIVAFGELSKKYCAKFGCSPMTFVNDAQMFRDIALENLGQLSSSEKPKEHKKKEYKVKLDKTKHTSNFGAILKDKGIIK